MTAISERVATAPRIPMRLAVALALLLAALAVSIALIAGSMSMAIAPFLLGTLSDTIGFHLAFLLVPVFLWAEHLSDCDGANHGADAGHNGEPEVQRHNHREEAGEQ